MTTVELSAPPTIFRIEILPIHNVHLWEVENWTL
jgi:hypothetical protein